jgi:hypothetical protein
MKLSLGIALTAALLALPACDGGDDTTTSNATPATTTDPTTDPMTSTDPTTDTPTSTDPTTGGGALAWEADVYTPIIAPTCTCHAAGSGGLVMGDTAASAYAALVGVASTNGGGLNYVEPGNSAMSYMYHKVNNTQADVGGVGGRMPLGGMLEQAQIDTIKQWIDDGANM